MRPAREFPRFWPGALDLPTLARLTLAPMDTATLNRTARSSWTMKGEAGEAEVRVVYDGGCPLCRACVLRLRPRQQGTKFSLIDARLNPEEIRALAARGFDLNDGIVVDSGGRCRSGAEAAHALASLHGGVGILDRAAIWAFGSRGRAERLYPLFKAGRRLLLLALNRSPL